MKNSLLSLLLCLSVIVNNFIYAKESTRLQNGKPAPGYWQQRTDYDIKAELQTGKKMLNGTGTVTYFNNSPDTLTTLVWHLYQNIFKKDSSPRKMEIHSSRAASTTNGIHIESINIDGVNIDPIIDETIMETPLTAPLLPKTSIKISIAWNYEIPDNSDLRTGYSGKDFGMAQWYPQTAVYDDIRGWDRTPYFGIAEFYTEYGNWDVELTVPKNYIIASTGTLMNPGEVLSPSQLARFNSLSADSTSRIILPDEILSSKSLTTDESTVWKFTAKDVRDFAWAASPNFVWDGTMTSEGVRIYAFYHPDEYKSSFPLLISDASNWDNGAQMAKHSIEYYSQHYGRYIYPQASIVSGPVSGMEYPMLAFGESGNAIVNLLYYVIAHELGHQWFPMMIGSNETNYPFMDEGFTTYITQTAEANLYGNDAFITPEFLKKYSWMNIPQSNIRLLDQRLYLLSAKEENESPILTHPYNVHVSEYGVMAYQKPGSALVMLEDMLGSETFSKAMNEYYSRWLLKHPYPDDFFNTIEDVAGRDLDWFWNQWFVQTWKLDMAVENVSNTQSNGYWSSTIVLKNVKKAVMPATLRLTLDNGTTREIRFSESVWSKGNLAEIRVDSLPSEVTNVVIDPDMKLADVNRLNNSWSMPPVVFDYGLNIANTLLYPLDAYRINTGPAIGFNLRDGFELGTIITGNYMGSDHDISLYTTYGVRSNVPDYELSYSTPLRLWDPQLTTSARLFRLDGFSGWQWMIEKTFKTYTNLARNFRREFVINTSILSIRVNDDRYLADTSEWNRSGNLDAGFIALKYFEYFSGGKFFVRLEDEFGTPTSSFSYSKLTSEVSLNHTVLGIKLNWRLFGGSSIGNVPVQTAHSLTQANPLERFDHWFFRTPVVGGSLRDNFSKPGGGNLFLQHDTSAMNVAAFNFALSKGPFVLFADAGSLWDSTTTRLRQFFYDAGIGLVVNLGTIKLPSYTSGPIGFGIYFPFFIKDPSRPADKEIDYRWRVVLGIRM